MNEFEQSDLEKETNDSHNTFYQGNSIRPLGPVKIFQQRLCYCL